jgi:hypothetical protein
MVCLELGLHDGQSMSYTSILLGTLRQHSYLVLVPVRLLLNCTS